jgi:hypothetical protein
MDTFWNLCRAFSYYVYGISGYAIDGQEVRSVQLDLFVPQEAAPTIEPSPSDNGGSSTTTTTFTTTSTTINDAAFAVHLKRRNDIDLYGKHVTYELDKAKPCHLGGVCCS